MEILVESFPFVFGVLLGISIHRLGGGLHRRWPVWAPGSAALGAFATLCTGEYRESLLYFAWDISLVAAVSAGVVSLMHWREQRQRV